MAPRPPVDRAPGGALDVIARRTRARAAAVLLTAALLAALTGAGVRPTAASWLDTTSARARITVASDACTATGVYAAQASGALLAGTVQGSVVGTGSLVPVSTDVRTDAVSRSAAVTTPGSASLATASGIGLTPASSWGQAASTTGTGTSTATAGGAAAVGDVDVSGLLTRAPDRSGLLPGLSGVGLAIGSVTSSSRLDGCAAAWGDPDTLTRSSSVSRLGLRFSDAAVGGALDSLAAQGVAAATALTGAAGAARSTPALAQAVSDGLSTTVGGVLGTAAVAGPPVTTVSLTAVTGPITATATAADPKASGRSTLDVGTRTVVADLPVPTGPNGDALSAARTAAIALDTATVLRARATALTDSETTARDSAPLSVTSSVDVLGVAGARTTISLTATAPVSAWTSTSGSPPPVLTVTATLLGAPAAVDPRIVSGLAANLLPKVGAALATSFIAPTTQRITADVAAAGQTVDAAAASLAAHLAALPSVVAVTTDQRAALAADSWTGALAAGSGGVTAVRVRVNGATGVRADLFLGSTAAGPNRGASR